MTLGAWTLFCSPLRYPWTCYLGTGDLGTDQDGCLHAASSIYHSMPVETQNSFWSGSDILNHRVPPNLCTPSSMR